MVDMTCALSLPILMILIPFWYTNDLVDTFVVDLLHLGHNWLIQWPLALDKLSLAGGGSQSSQIIPVKSTKCASGRNKGGDAEMQI